MAGGRYARTMKGRDRLGAGMQFIESSIIGLRSAVITLTRRTTPLTFVLFPMVHVAEQQFYDEVAVRARSCQLIVAEGVQSRFVPAQEWMARHHRGHLVDQAAALRLETLGVPVHWETDPGARMKSALDHLKFHATDAVGAATVGLARKFIDPLALPSVEQAEAYDDDYLTGSWFDRMVEYNARVRRDPGLVCTLDAIYRDRAAEPMRTGVIWGAAHMPAVTAYLCGELGYKATSAEWLTVAHARSG
jgi:hypothetical protein